ncbi:MAG: hypothetical protein DHS20C14_20880 [Phycisphaeraceae bacterium]|nr:MAG: hypothetical protein DHS20C14_20880 [Phycisphaeraceae bacterium]
MRFTVDKKTRVRGFDLTPMIDVVLQLVIFFLFTAQFGELARTEIDLPNEPGEQAETTEQPTFIIDIDAQGELYLQSDPISLEAFVSLVSREIERAGSAEHISIRVRPDRLSRAADLNALTRRVAELGVARWSLATVAPDGRATP